jgi:hypothetical protein
MVVKVVVVVAVVVVVVVVVEVAVEVVEREGCEESKGLVAKGVDGERASSVGGGRKRSGEFDGRYIGTAGYVCV